MKAAGTCNVLLVSPLADDRRLLAELLPESEWKLRFARTVEEAVRIMRQNRIGVVLCEERLVEGDWKDVLDRLRGERLVVTSRRANERLWAEVLNLGGYDVLAKPWDRFEVLSALASAFGKGSPARLLHAHVPVEEMGAC